LSTTVPSLKALHLALALTSISGFMIRGFWMWQDSPRLTRRWVKIAPHIIDTGLLVTGTWLALWLPAAALAGWLPAKLGALLAYIGLGMLALRPGRIRSIRVTAFFTALLVFAYIAGVAVTRSATVALI